MAALKQYTRMVPGAHFRDENENIDTEEIEQPPPAGMVNTDSLELTFRKNAWRITGIERTQRD